MPRSAGALIDLRALYVVLRQQFWLVAATAAFVVVATAVVLSQISPRYTASVLVRVDATTQRLTDRNALPASVTTSTGFVQGETDIIQSDAVLRRAVDDLALLSREDFVPEHNLLGSLISAIFGSMSSQGQSDPTSLMVHHLQENLSVKRIGLTYNIRVAFNANDSDLAAEIANGIVDSYIARQIEEKVQAAQQASGALRLRVQQISSRLDQLEAQIAEFIATNVGRPGSSVTDDELQSLNTSIMSLSDERQTMEQALLGTRLATSAGSFEGALEALRPLETTPTVESVQSLADELELLLSQRVSAATDEAPNFNLALEQVSTEVGLALAKRVSDLRELEAVARDQLRLILSESDNANGVELFRLQAEAESARALYRTALDLLNQANLGSDIQVPDARVVSVAVPPIEASFPPNALIMSLSVLAGLSLGTGLAYARHHYATGFQTARQVEQTLNLPVVASVPFTNDTTDDPHDLVLTQPLAAFSEAHRRWKVGADGLVDPTASTTILVTSAVPGEGKSTLALSLARLSASAGKRTALVDCDLRSPTLAELTHLTDVRRDKIALRDYLCAQTDEFVLSDIIHKDTRSAVHLVIGRTAPRSPSDTLLGTRRFAQLMHELRSAYDLVILDTPPLGPVVDARIVLKFADLATLVIKQTATTAVDVEAAAKELETPGSPPVCVVLNMMEDRPGSVGLANVAYKYVR